MEAFKSRKFILAVLGASLCVVWAFFKLDKEYLILALTVLGVYVGANLADSKLK
jgi:uncharacterized membrane protein